MRRREFITLLGGTVAAWPLEARAQQDGRVRRIGVLHSFAEDDEKPFIDAFEQSLQQLGWSAARNIRFDHRFGANDAARFRTYAAELVGLAPDVLVATTTPVLQALQQRTQTIPIVFYRVSDPLSSGVVASLARPGGNVTGFSNQEFSVSSKWLELLRDLAPTVRRSLIILDSENPTWRGYIGAIQTAAPSLGMEITSAPVIDSGGIDRAIADFARDPDGSLVVLPSPFIVANRLLIVELAIRHRLPAICGEVSFMRVGGLMFYGPDTLDQVRKAAGYVDRILKGAKPGDLPVQQPTKFSLIINLKTAKAIGLDVPATLLSRADEVIE